MNADAFNRLHTLRMENDAAGYAMEEQADRFARMAGRHENGTAPRAVVAPQLFQTPPEIARMVAEAAQISAGARILEPSAGLGRLLDALQPFHPGEVMAVEMSPACTAELYLQNRPGVTIKQRDFLTVQPADTGLFDRIVMNPPFTMRADIKHIQHARQFLKPGGILSAICFDTPHRETALQAIAASWVRLPANAFAKEGTRVNTILLTIENL